MTLHCTSASRSHVGMVRQHNEDAFLDRPDLGLWAVADGMGGHYAGDVASALIVQRLGELEPQDRMSSFVDRVESALESVNHELRQLAESQDAATIGSTVAALLACGRHAVCAWAGDSRVYRLRAGALLQISQDHALVADLLDRGILTAEQAANHPQSNLVTRAVGAGDTLKLDLEILELEPGDRFILCSDGLDKEVESQEILDLAAGNDPASLTDALVDLALSRGSRDNVTVVAVQFGGQEDGRDDESEDTVPGFTAGRLLLAARKPGLPHHPFVALNEQVGTAARAAAGDPHATVYAGDDADTTSIASGQGDSSVPPPGLGDDPHATMWSGRAAAGSQTLNESVVYRLPTAAEWEYAASASGAQPEKKFNRRVTSGGNVIAGHDLVDALTGQENGQGLANHVGNAQELVKDGDGFKVRSGDFDLPLTRCHVRVSQPHDGGPDATTGFRLVRELG